MPTARLIYFLILFLFGSACASLDKAVVSDPSQRESLEALTLSPGYDIYQLRISLAKQIMKEYSMGGTASYSVPWSYHYLGVYLGNGLFYDANNNLSINITQLPELRHLQQFKVTKKPGESWKRPEVYINKGWLFYRKDPGYKPDQFKAIWRDSTVAIEESAFLPIKTIYVTDNSLQVQGGKHTITLKTQAECISLSESSRSPDVVTREKKYRWGSNKILLDRDYVVENKEKVIEITRTSGIFRRTYYFTKVDGSYYFFNKRYRGTKISIQDNKVIVEKNGEVQAVFLVEDTTPESNRKINVY